MLVLSLLPGIGLLDRAFEEEGFCIVRGPDLLWGGDIKRFHPPAGHFDGVIGGPPCQCFSQLVHIVRHNGYEVGENLIPEFERVVAEAQPTWWLMENVVQAPVPAVPGYLVDPSVLDNRWLGEVQSRKHRFSFGTRDGRRLRYDGDLVALELAEWQYRVCASDWRSPNPRRRDPTGRKANQLCNTGRGRSLQQNLALQGLPEDFFDGSPFSRRGKQEMLGNGVPLPMGRALARAVARAIGHADGTAARRTAVAD